MKISKDRKRMERIKEEMEKNKQIVLDLDQGKLGSLQKKKLVATSSYNNLFESASSSSLQSQSMIDTLKRSPSGKVQRTPR